MSKKLEISELHKILYGEEELSQDLIKHQALSLVRDYGSVFGTAEGKKVLWDILNNAGIFAGMFTGNSQTFYNLGRRDIGLRVLEHVMAADPTIFTSILNKDWQKGNLKDE